MNYGYGLTNWYFEEEAEREREEERRWEYIIGNIGEGPFYFYDGYLFGEELAVEVFNEEFGVGKYYLDEWEVTDDYVINNYKG